MEILNGQQINSSNNSNNNNSDSCSSYDLIIVGAGISGSHAAYTIKKKCSNMRILMIEGKSRVGGRTETIEKKSAIHPDKTIKWDLGGQWVSKSQRNVMKLIGELGIQTHKQYNAGKRVLEANGKVSTYTRDMPSTSYLSKIDMNNYIDELDRMNDKLSVVQPYSNDAELRLLNSRSMKEYLDSITYTPTLRAIFNSNIRAISGLEADQVNGLFGLMQIKSCHGMRITTSTSEYGAQESTMKGGSQQLTIKMLEHVAKLSQDKTNNGFDLMLNTQLVEVKQSVGNKDDLVEIVTRNTLTNEIRVFRSKKLISSIPINQYINVKFTPELPLFKRNVFKYCQIGNYIKFFVTYKTAFWRENGYSGLMMGDGSVIHLSQEKFNQTYGANSSNSSKLGSVKNEPRVSLNKRMPTIGALVETYDATSHDGEPAIVGFFAGNGVHEWGDMTLELRRTEVIESLARYFGPQARQYTDYFEKNWAYEPFGGGCPSLNVISGSVMKDYARATREPFLNVHFCGTETATEWMGYMDGAIESGNRVANEILYTMLKSGLLNLSMLTGRIDFEKTYYHQLKEIDKVKELDEDQLKSSMKPLAKYQHFELSHALIGTIKKLLNIF